MGKSFSSNRVKLPFDSMNGCCISGCCFAARTTYPMVVHWPLCLLKQEWAWEVIDTVLSKS